MKNGAFIREKVLENLNKVIVGKEETCLLLLTALLADGHVLLEDVPGTGKTKLAKTLAKTLDAQFSRIQFTPDLLPTDITGLNIFDRQKNEFVFRKDLFLQTSFWQMKSTVPLPVPRRDFWNVWRSVR